MDSHLRHAFLIIAHNEFEVLRRLVKALDDDRTDIFIHFDRKVKELPVITTQKSGLHVLEDRVDVRWGSIRQIKTELRLFQTAYENGPYVYYHLISGTHMPVKPLQQLLDYYDEHCGQELMRLWEYDAKDVLNKMSTYHFFMNWYNSENSIIRTVVQKFWRCNLAIQRIAGIKRGTGVEFRKADNWLSLTHEAIAFLVSEKTRILKKYRYTFCADEYFVPTELFACVGRFRITNCRNLLFAKFEGANAVALNQDDVQNLKGTDYLFARKFSVAKPEALELIEKLIWEY